MAYSSTLDTTKLPSLPVSFEPLGLVGLTGSEGALGLLARDQAATVSLNAGSVVLLDLGYLSAGAYSLDVQKFLSSGGTQSDLSFALFTESGDSFSSSGSQSLLFDVTDHSRLFLLVKNLNSTASIVSKVELSLDVSGGTAQHVFSSTAASGTFIEQAPLTFIVNTSNAEVLRSGFVTVKVGDASHVAPIIDGYVCIDRNIVGTQSFSLETQLPDSSATSISDLIAQLKHVVGIAPLSGFSAKRADVDGSGDITISDVIFSLKVIVGLSKPAESKLLASDGRSSFTADDLPAELEMVTPGDVDSSWGHSTLTFGKTELSSSIKASLEAVPVQVPIVDSIAISSASGIANGLLNAGDVVTVTVTMDEVTIVTGTPRVALTVGDTIKYATYASGSNSTSLVFTYMVEASLTDADGISIGANALELNGGTLTDVAGNSAVIAHNVVAANSSYRVDTTAPTVSITSDVSSLKAGETAALSFNFSEAPDGFAESDISLVGGALSNFAVDSTDASVYTATFTPTADGSGTASISVVSGSYTDRAGNAGGAGATPTLTFDTDAPSASAVAITSATNAANNYLNAGDVVTVTVTMDEVTIVTGTPRVALTVGDTIKYATYASGSNSTSLVFTYMVEASLTDADGISIGANALELNGGTLTDVAGNSAVIAHNVVAANSSYRVDTTAPTPNIGGATDDVGSNQGVLVTGATTDDTLLELFGSCEIGSSVAVYDGTTLLGAATVNGSSWFYTASVEGGQLYNFKVRETDAAGNVSDFTSGFSVTGTGAIPQTTATITGLSDNQSPLVGNLTDLDFTNDTSPTITGTLSAALLTGETVAVYNGTTKLGAATVGGQTWSYTPASALSDGQYQISAAVENSEGVTGTFINTVNITVDTLAPTLAITASDTLLSIGDTSVITLTFSELPASLPNITASAGTLSAFTQSQSNPLVFTATLAPPDGIVTGAIGLTVGSWSDSAGNSGSVSSTPSISYESVMGFAFLLDAPAELSLGDMIVTDSLNNVSITGTLSDELNGSKVIKYSLNGGTSWSTVTDTNLDPYAFDFSVSGLSQGINQLEVAIFDGATHGQISRQDIFVEGTPATISLVDTYFNLISNSMTLRGVGIDALLLPTEDASTDIKSRFDWTKMSWDVSGTATTFTVGDIESVYVVDASCLQINFSSQGTSKLTAAGVGSGDALSVTTGFLQQVTGTDITSATLTDCTIRLFASASGETGAFDLFDQFVIDFGEVVQRGSGVIYLRDANGNIVESFDAATSASIAVVGTSAVITPTWKLQGSTGYYLTYGDGAFIDASGQAFSGVSNSSVLSVETTFENQNVLGFTPMRTEYPGDVVETLGMHSVLYVPLMFADVPTSPYATYQFKSPAFESNLSNLIRENTLNDTNDFYLSTSQGSMTFNGVMSQPFIVPIAYSLQQTLTQIGIDKLSYPMLLAKDAATRAGYSTDNNVVVSHWNMALVGPVALGGGNSVWLVPRVSDAAVLAHEAGHALDLGHASASFWGGAIVEYGNVLDNMGTAEAINGDFGAVIKYQRLGWIEPEAYLSNPGSGVYRLSPMDQENRVVGEYYGMSQSIASDELGDNPSFALEYRTSLTNDYWDNDLSPLKDQVLVLRNNVLIDRIDEGKQTQVDAGIFVGETWQIPGSQTYFSVLGKGENSEYLDVVHLEGPFTENLAPTAQVSASRTSVAAGDSVTFTTSAFDDNGDGLLYFWRFSDDVRGYGANYTRTFSQTSPTDITGTLVVSDMRGGTSTHTITVHAGASASDSVVQTVGAITRIMDSTLPTVAINAVNAVSVEGGELGHFVIKRAGTDFDSTLIVNLSYAGSATLSTDYTAPTSVTIAAGQSETSFDITPINDTVLEASESITVAIAADSNYTISSQNTSAKIELRDNDTPVVTVEVLDGQAVEGSDDRAMVVFQRTGPTTDPLTIYYGLTGDAYNGGDYNRLDGQITFAAGEATVALPITAIDDEVGEATEQVSIYLTAFDQLYSVGPQNSATVNLVDNNDRPVVNLVNAQAIQNEGTTSVLTFEVVGGNGSQLTVFYGVSGSASAADYETLSGTITLPTGGRQTATLEIDLRNDALVEGYEVLQIDLLESEDYLIGTQSRVQQVIRDADQSYENGEVIVSPFALISGQSVDESKIFADHEYVDGVITNAKVENIDTALRFYMSRAETGGGDDLKVFFGLNGSATPGIDYTARVIDSAPMRSISAGNPTEILKEFTSLSATNNELIIPGSFNGVIVEIIPIDDSLAEGTETITLNLERAEHLATGDSVPLGLLQTATLHLDDNDGSPVQIQFAQSYTVIGENAAADQRVYEIPVELSAVSTDTITVGYYISAATAHGLGSDYTLLNAAGDPVSEGSLSFAPGQTTQKIYIAVKPDAIPEGIESLTIALEHPTNASLATPTVSDDLHHRVYIFDTMPDQHALTMVKEERWYQTDVYDNQSWDAISAEYQSVLPEFATTIGTNVRVSRKLVGKVTATETGDHTFFLTHDATDGYARFYISTDDTEQNKALKITSTTSQFEDWSAAQQATVSLVAGQSYYIEIQQRKSADIALGWKLPGSTVVNTVQTSFNPEATTEPYTAEFVVSKAFYTEGESAEVYLTLDRPNPKDSISVTIAVDAEGSSASTTDYTLSTTTLTFAPGETTKSIDLGLLTDAVAEAPEVLVLKIQSATGAKVSGNQQMDVWLTDALAPDIATSAAALSVSRDASDGAVIGSLTATAQQGRSISSWEIVSGNPQLQDSSTGAFVINSAGQLALANASALPLGDYALRVLVKATDSEGASSLSWIDVNIGAGTAGAQTMQTGFDVQTLGEYSFASSAGTDTGTVNQIMRGEVTRDNTLKLHGVADAGTLVRVYDGSVLIGETVALTGDNWSLTTPVLGDGEHTFRAEMITASGNIGTTDSVMYRIHSQTEVLTRSLLTADDSPGTSSSAPITAIEAVSETGTGAVVYSRGGELYLADNAVGGATLVTHNQSGTGTAAGAVVDFGGISTDATKIVFATDDVAAFGFTDVLTDTQTPFSDLILFDRADGSLSLVTSTISATTSNSAQAQFVGFSGDNRYVVYTTENAERISVFSAPDKAAPVWTLFDGQFVQTAGSSRQTQVNVSDIDLTNFVFEIGGLGVAGIATKQFTLERWNDQASLDPSGNPSLTAQLPTMEAPRNYTTSTRDSSTKITGTFTAQSAGEYIFYPFGNSDSEFYIDGALKKSFKIDLGVWSSSNSVTVSLAEGQTIAIDLRMEDGNNSNHLALWVDTPTTDSPQPLSISMQDLPELSATVDSSTIVREAGKLTFWIEAYESSSNTTKAVQLELADSASGITTKVLAAKESSNDLTGSDTDWASIGTSTAVAGDNDESGLGINLIKTNTNLTTAMLLESGQAGATDIIAYDTATGNSTLLTHSEVASGKESSVADASDIHISGDGNYVVFSVLDASNLGNGDSAIIDASPTSKDWLATNIATGQIQLLSHTGTSSDTSAGMPLTFLGTANSQPYAIFACDDTTALGFTDAGANVGDLVAVNLGTGEIKLISHTGTASSSISANTAITFEKIIGDYVYFSAADVSVFGFQDGYTNELDLLRYSVSTGAIELMTHTHDSLVQSIKGSASLYRDGFSMGYTPGSVIASNDGRYVSFATDVAAISTQYSQIISNSFRFDPGNLTFIADTETGTIRGLDTEVITGDEFGPGRYANWDTAYFTPDGSAFVWQTTQMRGIATTHESVFEGNSNKFSGNAVLVLDLTEGVKNAGAIQTSTVLTHGPDGVSQVYAGNDVVLLGVSNDSRFAFVQVDDVSNLGNDGVPFVDAPSQADIVAIELATQKISLLTGENYTSLGFDFSLLGSSQTGNVMLGTTNDLDALEAVTGAIDDQNTAIDVVTWGGSLLALSEQNTSGTISLISRVNAGAEFVLLDDGVAVDRQTADADGIILWSNITLQSSGEHRLSLQDPSFASPAVGDDETIANTLILTAEVSNEDWTYSSALDIV